MRLREKKSVSTQRNNSALCNDRFPATAGDEIGSAVLEGWAKYKILIPSTGDF